MNRRSFLLKILKAAVAPMILPGALLYARNWIRTGDIIVPRDGLTSAVVEEFRTYLLMPGFPQSPWLEIQTRAWPHGMGDIMRPILSYTSTNGRWHAI